MENGKWRMENGEWKMENGEWKMENGEWKMENGEWKSGVVWASTYPIHTPQSNSLSCEQTRWMEQGEELRQPAQQFDIITEVNIFFRLKLPFQKNLQCAGKFGKVKRYDKSSSPPSLSHGSGHNFSAAFFLKFSGTAMKCPLPTLANQLLHSGLALFLSYIREVIPARV